MAKSSSLTGDIKQASDVLCKNTTLEELVLYKVTGITDEDITHMHNMNYNSPTVTSQIMVCGISVKDSLKTKD